MSRTTNSPRLFIGLIIVAVAGSLLLEQAGVLETERLLAWWPLGPIALGFMQIVWSRGAASRVLGAAIVAAGAVFLYASLYPDELSMQIVWGYTWPSLLLLVGIAVLSMGFRKRDIEDDEGRLDGVAVMSGQSLRNTSQVFGGGDLTAMMGGFELDLTDARMDGDVAVLDVFVVMGGIELRVPADWRVEPRVACFLGGIENKTHAPDDVRHVLRVQGFVLMGGIEIGN